MLILVEDRDDGPVVGEPCAVPVAARVVVPALGVMLNESPHVARHVGAALVDECVAAIVGVEIVKLPRVGIKDSRGHGVCALVEPDRHRGGMCRDRMRALAYQRILAAHRSHEVT